VRAVGVETRDHAQVLLVQSAVGADVVRALLNELSGADTGKVITREPTLEDAYVELVRSA
jgi:ABC-2 type transport system ATP-binding protein